MATGQSKMVAVLVVAVGEVAGPGRIEAALAEG